jgi:hypothetical protein
MAASGELGLRPMMSAGKPKLDARSARRLTVCCKPWLDTRDLTKMRLAGQKARNMTL